MYNYVTALALIFSVLIQFSSNSVFASPSPLKAPVKNYYGDKFYALISMNSLQQSDALVAEMRNVLHGGHIKTAGFDKIVASCDLQGSCYQHAAIGYNAARVFIFEKFNLVQTNNQYFIKDVYCNHEYGPEDFSNGQGPSPTSFPANTVLNVEHTWPQSKFTSKFPKEMQKSDLHHLFPSDSQLNSTRGSFIFGEVVKDKAVLKCPDSRFGYPQDSNQLVFEPPKEHRGNVARALFYFATKYEMNITPAEEAILRKWDQEDPIDGEEIRRNDAVFLEQHSRNPFVDVPGLATLIRDL